MRRLLGLVVFVAFAAAGFAQIHGTPASVTSIGFSHTPPVRASVTSLGPNGFAPRFGAPRFGGGVAVGHNPRFFMRFDNRVHHFDNRFPRRRAFPVVVPLVVPYYPLYPDYTGYSYPVGYDDAQAAGTYAVDDHAGTTILERNYQPASPPMNDASDARYGQHYLDRREDEARNDVHVVPGPQAPAREASKAPESQEPATVLIFKNGDRMEVHNYAIVGDTVWVISGATSHKYALSELDLPNTTKENDERGLEFRLPKHG